MASLGFRSRDCHNRRLSPFLTAAALPPTHGSADTRAARAALTSHARCSRPEAMLREQFVFRSDKRSLCFPILLHISTVLGPKHDNRMVLWSFSVVTR